MPKANESKTTLADEEFDRILTMSNAELIASATPLALDEAATQNPISDENMRIAKLFDTSRTGELTEKELSDVNMYLMPFLLEETERSDRALLISKLIQMVRNRDAALQAKDAERERLFNAATALINDVRSRYPNEELRCPYMRELYDATKEKGRGE